MLNYILNVLEVLMGIFFTIAIWFAASALQEAASEFRKARLGDGYQVDEKNVHPKK